MSSAAPADPEHDRRPQGAGRRARPGPRDRPAFDREEHTLGICAVGVAVAAAEPVAAISVPVPAQRFGQIEARVVAALTAAAGRASELLLGAAG